METVKIGSEEQAQRADRSRGHWKACFVAFVVLAGCGSRTIVGAGIAHSSGSVAASGFKNGIGAGAQVGHYRRLGSNSLGVVAAADFSGYSSDGDADEILWTELQVRYRRDLRGHGQPGPYFALGPALGYSHRYIDRPVVGAVFELGYELRLVGPVALDLSLRERPAFFINDDPVYAEFHNTLMLGLDLVILGPAPAR